MPLIITLAARNLFHDRLRFIATIIGIVFSMVLVTVQMGLFLSFERMVTTMIDHAPADLWIVPNGTKNFEVPTLLDEHERFRALSVKGVVSAVPVLVGFAQWRTESGTSSPVFIVGSDLRADGLRPWDVVAGDVEKLSVPDAIAVDRTYLGRLEVSGIGATAEIRNQRALVQVLTNGIRSFTTSPYVFTTIERARTYTGTPANKFTYLLVRLARGTPLESTRSRLQQALSKAEVLTPAELRSRSRSFWLFGTGAGAALFAGALLGVIVGTVVVAQTLYASTKDHLNEFATLRAIGSSGRYIYTVIIIQALLSAIIGFCVAAGIGFVVVMVTANSALPVFMTPPMTASLLVLSVLMCIVSAIAAIMKVVRVDPAMVFTR
jgi:putative ABC transport system permease protein